MQRTCVLLAAAGIACAPLGCQTVSDVFNEPPADTQRTERAEDTPEDSRERSRARASEHIPASSCPMRVEGARVAMVDITDGIALEFTAGRGGDVEQIRERARRLMDTQRSVSSAEDLPGADLEPLPPARVEYDAQRNGARLEFKVDTPAELRELRTQLRERMDVLRGEENCPRDMMTMRARGSDRAG